MIIGARETPRRVAHRLFDPAPARAELLGADDRDGAGSQVGECVAVVLLGDVRPAGKLAFVRVGVGASPSPRSGEVARVCASRAHELSWGFVVGDYYYVVVKL